MSKWAINVLRRIVRDLNVYRDGRNVSESALDTFVVSLELVYRDLIAQQLLNEQGVDDTNLNEGAQLVQTTLQMFNASNVSNTEGGNLHLKLSTNSTDGFGSNWKT